MLKGSPGGDPDLLLDEIHARKHLRDRMLDLDTRVHLYKVELFVLDQKFHGTSVRIPSLPCQPNRRLSHLFANPLAYTWRRGLLEHLLSPALHRALALVEVDHVPLVVAHDLHFDVPRRNEQLLQVERPVPESGVGLAPGYLYGFSELVLILGHPDAAATATRRCFDHDRIPYPISRLCRLVSGRGIVRTGHDRHLCLTS